MNVKNQRSGVSVDDRASDNDVISYSEDTLSDADRISLEKSVPTPTGDTSWCFEDDVISGICECGALGRAHKRDCPSNSRNHYVGCILFPKASSADSDKNGKNDDCVKSKPPKASKPVDTRSTRRGKREKPGGEKPPPAKRPRPNFKVGDCVNLHDSKLGKYHLPCCIVQVFGDRCLLCCHK